MKKDDVKEKVVPLDPPKEEDPSIEEEFMGMQKVMKIHDKLVYKNVALIEGLGENVTGLQKNMKAVNEVIKRMTNTIGDVTKLLQTIIKRLPK